MFPPPYLDSTPSSTVYPQYRFQADYSGRNHLTRCITNREAAFGMVIPTIFVTWQHVVLWSYTSTRLLWYAGDCVCWIRWTWGQATKYNLLHASMYSVSNGSKFLDRFRFRFHPKPDRGNGSCHTENLAHWKRAGFTTKYPAFQHYNCASN